MIHLRLSRFSRCARVTLVLSLTGCVTSDEDGLDAAPEREPALAQPSDEAAALQVRPDVWMTGGPVDTVAVNSGVIYLGGRFTWVGPWTGGAAAINATTGAVDLPLPRIGDRMDAVTLDGSDGWFIGGPTGLHRVTASGMLDSWAVDGPVNALVLSGTTLYVGGDFDHFGGQPRRNIAALDVSTGLATAWNPSANDEVTCLAVGGATIYTGGRFSAIGGQPRASIAALSASTGQATGWNPGADHIVSTIVANGGVVYVGGFFATIGFATPRRHLAALDATTGIP